LAIIRRKLSPPDLPPELVPRPRLSEPLAALITGHAVVGVTATAGAGKTTVVREATDRLPLPVAWLTIDGAEAAPGRLLAYVEAAIAGQVPAAAGAGTRALAAGAQHVEAAGLLVDATAGVPLVLVLDQLERLADAPLALGVISALLRHAPAEMRTVLVSRRDLALEIHSTGSWPGIAQINESDLAFTVAEAATALSRHGQTSIDPAEAVAATGGWVAGILFEAWRSEEHVYGAGGEADPLHGYLASQILAGLAEPERDFLVHTSVLTDVTTARAEALGVAGAARSLERLRSVRLPATWSDGGRTLSCHPRFREYLLARLDREPAETRIALRTAYAGLLARAGDYEDATEEYLALGLEEEALRCAELAAPRVVERLDLEIAAGWVKRLTIPAKHSSKPLITAELMAAVGREEYGAAAGVSDRLLGLLGPEEQLPADLGAMIAWCYWLVERYEDCDAVLDRSTPGPPIAMFRWALGVEMLEGTGSYEDEPAPSGAAVDAIPLRLHWTHGRLDRLFGPQRSSWVEAVQKPWRIQALIALGRHDEALALAEEVDGAGWSPVFFDACVRPELLLAAGRVQDVWRAHLLGRDRVAETGSGYFKALNLLLEAKLALRLDRDTARARAVLERVEQLRAGGRVLQVMDEQAVWMGLTLLRENEDEEAARLLRGTVRRLSERDRMLHASAAAVYLAEAEWRLGDEEASDAAAELALTAARRLGSSHLLLSALEDFPAVAARRIDTEPLPDGEWHALGRSLLRRDAAVDLPLAPHLHLHDLGPMALYSDEEELRPRIAKSLELLAFLQQAPGRRASRAELLDALFDGRADPSARSYLRQAVGRLREVLPDESTLGSDAQEVWLGAVDVSTDLQRYRQALAEAADLAGEARLERLESALVLAGRGHFLEGARSEWAAARRSELEATVADTRLAAAEAAFGLGAYARAQELIAGVLAEDQFREEAWRLQMKVADALGDGDGLLSSFLGCERALAAAGLSPSPGTRKLLAQLQR